MRKGITPIVAIILLLLVTVVIVALAYTALQRSVGSSAQAVQNQSEQLGRKFNENFRIDNAAGNAVTVRNIGSVDIDTSKLSVYVDNLIQACTWSSATAAPGTVSTCTFSGSPCTSKQVKVVGPTTQDNVACV